MYLYPSVFEGASPAPGTPQRQQPEPKAVAERQRREGARSDWPSSSMRWTSWVNQWW